MPLDLPTSPVLLIRRLPFEQAGLTREAIDAQLLLTDQEFRVEGDLILVGPLHGDDAAGDLTDLLEARGLLYFDDFFDLSGNWPPWLRLFAMAERG